MAKIVLTRGDKVLQEIPLVKERVTIGRRPYNDVVIGDTAVSGEHATIHTSCSEAVLEDLNSTNGTLVNVQPINEHFLQNQDVIELAEYRLRYLLHAYASDESPCPTDELPENDICLDLILDSAYPRMWGTNADAGETPRSGPAIKLLTGASVGKEIKLTKVLTTLGQLGLHVAAIARRPDKILDPVSGDAIQRKITLVALPVNQFPRKHINKI